MLRLVYTILVAVVFFNDFTLADQLVNQRAMAANQTIRCSFRAEVVKLSRITAPPLAKQFKGYLIDSDPKWELTLRVHNHSQKIPFQPGVRKCRIADIGSVFGTPVEQISGLYEFSFLWNIDVTNKPEFENFTAERIVEQNK